MPIEAIYWLILITLKVVYLNNKNKITIIYIQTSYKKDVHKHITI
jgi:hypothetical protein